MRVRFSIRDLLWLAVVAALMVGWWIDHRKISADAASRDFKSHLEFMEMQRRLMALEPQAAWQDFISQLQAKAPKKGGMPIMRPPQNAETIPNAVDDAAPPASR